MLLQQQHFLDCGQNYSHCLSAETTFKFSLSTFSQTRNSWKWKIMKNCLSHRLGACAHATKADWCTSPKGSCDCLSSLLRNISHTVGCDLSLMAACKLAGLDWLDMQSSQLLAGNSNCKTCVNTSWSCAREPRWSICAVYASLAAI